MSPEAEPDVVWRALADSTRRGILDALRESPQTTGALCEQFPHLCRTAVMKHLDLLEAADLLIVRREGRLRWNHLNPVPIQAICDRWVSRYAQTRAGALLDLKKHVEGKKRKQSARKKSKRTKER